MWKTFKIERNNLEKGLNYLEAKGWNVHSVLDENTFLTVLAHNMMYPKQQESQDVLDESAKAAERLNPKKSRKNTGPRA